MTSRHTLEWEWKRQVRQRAQELVGRRRPTTLDLRVVAEAEDLDGFEEGYDEVVSLQERERRKYCKQAVWRFVKAHADYHHRSIHLARPRGWSDDEHYNWCNGRVSGEWVTSNPDYTTCRRCQERYDAAVDARLVEAERTLREEREAFEAKMQALHEADQERAAALLPRLQALDVQLLAQARNGGLQELARLLDRLERTATVLEQRDA